MEYKELYKNKVHTHLSCHPWETLSNCLFHIRVSTFIIVVCKGDLRMTDSHQYVNNIFSRGNAAWRKDAGAMV